jgi:hypothetical protein
MNIFTVQQYQRKYMLKMAVFWVVAPCFLDKFVKEFQI